MAQNVIVPVIDLTAAAEGSTVPQYLQTAFSFDSQNVFDAAGNTKTIANTTGFWRIYGISNIRATSSQVTNVINISNGVSTKQLWDHTVADSAIQVIDSATFDFVIFLSSGDDISATSKFILPASLLVKVTTGRLRT